MLVAITRPVSASLAQCELTHLLREPIDVARASQQHEAYEAALGSLGVKVVRAAAVPELPDAVFVEDMAIVLDEVAIMTRPGAASRRPEVPGVADVLQKYRPLVWMKEPATLDGGDVLRIGKTIYVGESSRTNREGIHQLGELAKHAGDYRVVPILLRGCLHLKSAVTQIADNLVLVNPDWLSSDLLPDIEPLEIDPTEPYAANALRIGETLIYPSHFPRTHERLLKRGLRVRTVDCGELAKAEGAVTCCSILFDSLR